MGLETYHEKRDFRSTAEPEGKVGVSDPANLTFVVQKHAATRLHYDFRLELDGVLLSWAVPKGPSLDPSEKRLAMRTEDHPIEYGSFEGIIPKGEYGGGTVLLWDRGTWTPVEDPHEGLKKGVLKCELAGERMRGGWHLVRTRTDAQGKETWILFKAKDDHALRGAGSSLVDDNVTSVESGRAMDEIAADKDRTWTRSGERPTKKEPRIPPERARRVGKAGKIPWPLAPQLATLAKEAPKGAGWLHEIKLDGYRVLIRIASGKVSIVTRSGNDWTARLGGVAAAAAKLPVDDAVIDGELVAVDEAGRTSFSALQQALGKTGGALFVYAFDLLALDGRDLRTVALRERKELLARIVPTGKGTIRFSEHLEADGPDVLEQACALGAEGIVSKRADRPYMSDRSRDWIKTKCVGRDDFLVGGFIEKEEGGLSSILLGERKNSGLVYVGRAGTGFTDRSRKELRARFDAMRIADCPFTTKPPVSRGEKAIWIEPLLVAAVAYMERTRDGILRHPVFHGLRDDAKVEAPLVSNAGKLMYPEAGITKGELATWVVKMAPLLLPSLVGRPLTLVRCPNGHHQGPRFYQKHHENVPDAIVPVDVGEEDPYCAIRDVDGLVALVQLAVLEVHPWGSRVDRPDRPDRLIIDLDPDERIPFAEVVSAAQQVRERLEEAGLTSFVRTTGGKGLHVVAPLTRRHGWDDVKAFSHGIAQDMVRAQPDKYVAVATKARRKGKIYIDYLRNAFGATAIGSWWFRARPGAPIARPLRWEDLDPKLDPSSFTVRTVREPPLDPWKGIDEIRQSLPARKGKRK